MHQLLKKNPDPETENIFSIQSNQEIPQDPKISKEIKQKDYPEIKELQNATVSELLAFFQRMKADEEKLLAIKQQILTQQQDLQNQLIKEIAKKKMVIANLVSEIPDIQNKTQQIGQVLGIDIYQ